MCDHRNPERGPMSQLGTKGKWMNERLLAFQGVSPFFFREVKCRFVRHASFLLSGKKVLRWHFLSGNAVWATSREVPCCGVALSGSPLRQSPPNHKASGMTNFWFKAQRLHSALDRNKRNPLASFTVGYMLQLGGRGADPVARSWYSVELRSC
jgi:hypothetical protein